MTLPRAVSVAACAVMVFFLAIVGVRCAGQSTGSQPSLGCDGQRVACWCCHSVRPAVLVIRVVVSGLLPGRISWGTACAIPRRAALLGAASGEAGQGLRLDRLARPYRAARDFRLARRLASEAGQGLS